MARPREFDEATVLAEATDCFWRRGYDATSVRDLVEKTGLTAASLYNAFGDKRALYRLTLDRYVEGGVADRIERCADRSPREAIAAFFREIVERSLGDADRKGCMLVNAALEVAPHDAEFRDAVDTALGRIEAFFHDQIEAGRADGTITTNVATMDLARHLLAILLGVRVLARVRPERALLEGAVAPALALLGERAPLSEPV